MVIISYCSWSMEFAVIPEGYFFGVLSLIARVLVTSGDIAPTFGGRGRGE